MSDNQQYTRSLYIDLELSCWLGPPPPEFNNNIIQIGLVEVNLTDLVICRTKKYYVRPKKFEISSYCTRLTGIRHRDIIEHGRPLAEIMASIQNEFGPKNKMCFAWGSDNTPIINECMENSIANPFKPAIIDLSTLFRSTFLLKQRMSLNAALEFLNVPFRGRAHDALVDAENTASLHLEMIRLLRRTKIELL